MTVVVWLILGHTWLDKNNFDMFGLTFDEIFLELQAIYKVHKSYLNKKKETCHFNSF